MTPSVFAQQYVTLVSRVWTGTAYEYRRTPIINYLQNGHDPQSANGLALLKRLREVLPSRTKQPGVNLAKTFKYDGFDYINTSIGRTFIGKACPWEIQETIQLLTRTGVVDLAGLGQICNSSLGTDCGGFVANYWGWCCPHMKDVAPLGFDGILPRNFATNSKIFPDAVKRRRASFEDARPGDAAIFFKDILNDDPDTAKQRDGNNKLIQGTGSEAFHIGILQRKGSGEIEICEASEGMKPSGGNGVGVRTAAVSKTGASGKKRPWAYCQTGANERIYFVAPPWGWGPEEAYRYGEM